MALESCRPGRYENHNYLVTKVLRAAIFFHFFLELKAALTDKEV
jgi:hypothetical protein